MGQPRKAAAEKAAAFSFLKSKGFDMSKIVKFPEDFYDMGVVKFAAGSYHPLNSETQSLVDSGYAELISADATVDHVEVLAALAKIAIDRAVAARQQADELEAEAEQAIALAKAAEERGTQAAPGAKSKGKQVLPEVPAPEAPAATGADPVADPTEAATAETSADPAADPQAQA